MRRQTWREVENEGEGFPLHDQEETCGCRGESHVMVMRWMAGSKSKWWLGGGGGGEKKQVIEHLGGKERRRKRRQVEEENVWGEEEENEGGRDRDMKSKKEYLYNKDD